MLIQAHWNYLRIFWHWRRPKIVIELIFLINYLILLQSFELILLLMIYLWLHVSRLSQLTFGSNFWLKFTILKLIFYLFESLQVLPISENIMQAVELLISILHVGLNGLNISGQNLSIPLDNRLDDLKEGKFLSLFTTQKFAIELDELKENAFN